MANTVTPDVSYGILGAVYSRTSGVNAGDTTTDAKIGQISCNRMSVNLKLHNRCQTGDWI